MNERIVKWEEKIDRPLRVLIVDDSAVDAELMIAIMRQRGARVTFDKVDSVEDYRQHIEVNNYDVILSDHNLRSWSAFDALEIVQQAAKDIPFIVVTGTLGEESAVEYLKCGASDFVLKEHLQRLPPAINRALLEKAQRDDNRHLQIAIRESKEDWERTFDAITDSLTILDRNFRIQRANRATSEFSGIQACDLLNQQCFVVMHGAACPPLNCPFRRMLLSEKEEEAEITEAEFDKVLHVSVIPLRNAEGRVKNAIHIIRDITQRKRLEEQLTQAQKMEAIGRLAGGVAHDFNNVLSIVSGYSELMEEQIPAEEELLRRQLAEIRKAATRAANVTQQLLAFSRKQVMQPTSLRLSDVVNDVIKTLRPLLPESIAIAVHTADEVGIVRADPTQMHQVLMNLLINARDAMPSGGELTILISNVDSAVEYPRPAYPAIPGKFVMLAISDTGMGMDQGTLTHIFEPFFTTKQKGAGTGFGLSVVYGIIKQSGGHLSVTSEPGHGTTFKIYLPRVACEVSNVVPILTAVPAMNAVATILVVENEEALLEMIASVLETDGYRVLRATNGADALRIVNTYRGGIDLLLSDVLLRGAMGGIELAKKLTAIQSQTRILFMSGHSEGLNQGNGAPEVKLLQKPFTNDELRQAIRGELGGVIVKELAGPTSLGGTTPVRQELATGHS